MTSLQTPPKSEVVNVDDATAFVLGNGPSLKRIDLRRLSAYKTIGLNAAYRYWRRIDWRPSYYACLDHVVGMSHKAEIAELIREGRIQRFLLRGDLIDALGELGRDPRVEDFEVARLRDALLDPPAITTGSHAALWAASLGHTQIVILGVDGRYVEIVPGAETRDEGTLEIVESTDNPNYFFEDYQQPGDRYNLPNPRPDLHVGAWRDAASKLLGGDVRLYNGNPQSAVRVFPFIDVDTFLEGGCVPEPADETLEVERARRSDPKEAPAKRRGRLFDFARKNGVALSIITAWTAVISIWTLAAAPAGLKPPIFLLAVLSGAVAAGLLYSRYVIIQHLAKLQRDFDTLQTRLRDVERRR